MVYYYDSKGYTLKQLTLIGTITTFFTALGLFMMYVVADLLSLSTATVLLINFFVLFITAVPLIYALTICPCLPFLWGGCCHLRDLRDELMNTYDPNGRYLPTVI